MSRPRAATIASASSSEKTPAGESRLFGGAEIANPQCVHAGFTIGQFFLGRIQRAMLQDGAVVLRSETIAEGRSLGFAAPKIIASDDDHNDEYSYCNDDLGNRELMKHCLLLCGISSAAKSEGEGLCG
jgi:hypothetical protein